MKARIILVISSLALFVTAALMPILLGIEQTWIQPVSTGLFIAAFFIFLLSGMQRVRMPVMGKGNAVMDIAESARVTFQDVAANEIARRSLMELTDFLKTPEKFAAIGARIPHGVLLYGPPGTGKTLLARALAGEAGVPFLAMNGSDFVEMYVGVGASRVREVFKKARKLGKCVIFIDEIDSLGRARGINSSDERDQTLNALLSEMSGFTPSEGIIVVAATNRADTLDPALLRPGRFDRRIEVGMPGAVERLSILRLHSRNKRLSENVDLTDVAAQTVFFSGASLENLMNEAAIRTVRRGGNEIENADIQAAFVSLIAGEEKQAQVSAKEKGFLALHEAGHAVVSHVLIPENALKRVSIIPSSSGAAGYNLTVPTEHLLYTRDDMKRQICVLLAGRAAEEMILGEENVTGGASNDLKRAAEIAAAMAGELGLGNEMYVSASVLSRLTGGGNSAYSTAIEILENGYNETKTVIQNHADLLMTLTETLMKEEALDDRRLEDIFSHDPVSNDSHTSTQSVNS